MIGATKKTEPKNKKGVKGTSGNGDSFRLSGGGMKFVTLVIVCILAIGSTVYNIASAYGQIDTIKNHQEIHCKKFDDVDKQVERNENKIDRMAEKQAEMAGDVKVIRTLLEQATKPTPNK